MRQDFLKSYEGKAIHIAVRIAGVSVPYSEVAEN